jgi:DNA-binding XRE family transcriptional regulator
MSVTSAQIRMARAALDWTVRDLAKAAGLHRNTITNIERGRGGDPATLTIIEITMTKAGIEFTEEGNGRRGVRLHPVERISERARIEPGSEDYIHAELMSTQYVGAMTPAQCRSARALLAMTQPELARAAGVGLSTIVDFERQRRRVSPGAAQAIRLALEAHGIQLIDEDGGGPGVRLRKPQRGKGHK